MKLIICVSVLVFASIVSSMPQYMRDSLGLRPPQRTVMMSSFYGPPYKRYVPQTAMTAFASGADTITTGMMSGSEPERPAEQTAADNWEAAPEDDSKNEVIKSTQEVTEVPAIAAEVEEAATTIATVSSTRKPKRIPKRKQKPQAQEEDDDDDKEDGNSWPFGKPGARGGVPNFTFFPIMFGSSLGRSSDGSPAGAATAIANSFSTGKGGVASSHATAFGDPETFRSWKKNLKRTATPQDEE